MDTKKVRKQRIEMNKQTINLSFYKCEPQHESTGKIYLTY